MSDERTPAMPAEENVYALLAERMWEAVERDAPAYEVWTSDVWGTICCELDQAGYSIVRTERLEQTRRIEAALAAGDGGAGGAE